MESRSLQAAAALLEPISFERDMLLVRVTAGRSGVLDERLPAMLTAVRKAFGSSAQLKVHTESVATKPIASSADDGGGDSAVIMVSEVFDAQVVQIRNLKEDNDV